MLLHFYQWLSIATFNLSDTFLRTINHGNSFFCHFIKSIKYKLKSYHCNHWYLRKSREQNLNFNFDWISIENRFFFQWPEFREIMNKCREFDLSLNSVNAQNGWSFRFEQLEQLFIDDGKHNISWFLVAIKVIYWTHW